LRANNTLNVEIAGLRSGDIIFIIIG
jgi:hypothetical protein